MGCVWLAVDICGYTKWIQSDFDVYSTIWGCESYTKVTEMSAFRCYFVVSLRTGCSYVDACTQAIVCACCWGLSLCMVTAWYLHDICMVVDSVVLPMFPSV
jgi:hypothetical protein